MTFDLVLRGDIVFPDHILPGGYLAVRDGQIAAIGQGEDLPAGKVEDFSGCLLFPGLIDAQVHAGSIEGTAGLRDATRAAAAGGVTTIVDMPFDNPQPVNSVDLLRSKIDTVNNIAAVDVALYATVPKNCSTRAVRELAEAGACAIKLSTYEYHPSRFPRSTMGDMYQVFSQAAELNLPVAFHNEDQEIVLRLTAEVKAAGHFGPETHGLTRPPIAEIVANAQVLELGLQTGARTHIVHSSIIEGFDMVDRYRALGAKASAETCLQYLIFNEEDVVRKGPSLKQTPPLRSEQQRQAIWQALASGRVAIVSTDHVAWPLSTKNDADMFKNNSGVPGLETLLPIFYSALVDRNLSPTIIANVCALNVAKHFGLVGRKGSLSVGCDADVAVLRPEDGTFHAAEMVSAEKWSPYDGFPTKGKVVATYLRGKKVFADGKMLSENASGCFVRPG